MAGLATSQILPSLESSKENKCIRGVLKKTQVESSEHPIVDLVVLFGKYLIQSMSKYMLLISLEI